MTLGVASWSLGFVLPDVPAVMAIAPDTTVHVARDAGLSKGYKPKAHCDKTSPMGNLLPMAVSQVMALGSKSEEPDRYRGAGFSSRPTLECW